MSKSSQIERRRKGKNAEGRMAFLFLLPAMLLLAMFFYIPVLYSFFLGFTNARLGSMAAGLDWVGVTNFQRVLFDDPVFWTALKNILFFVVLVVPIQGGLGLALALLINQKLRGITAFRVMFFMPVVTSMVVVSMLWRFLYQQEGLINAIFGFNIDWLNNPSTALPAIVVMSVWQGVGFHMIIWLSGLQTIDASLYEAAKIDGAGAWNRFRYVTIPGLKPTFVFILITITIAAFSLFTQVDIMTDGGPNNATVTLVYYIIQQGSARQSVGYASAISLIFFVIVLAISLIQRQLTRGEDD